MDSRQLTYFRSVVDNGSFTHAAQALHMTQPSLSLSVSKLERDLGVRLLSRSRKGVSTTREGAYLYKAALQVENLLDEAQRRIREIASGAAGDITINTAPEFNWLFMPEVVSRMLDAAPGVTILLDTPDPDTALHRVLDGAVDVALIPSPHPHSFAQRYSDKLMVHRAAEFPFLLAIPKRLNSLPNPVSLKQVAQETWLIPTKHEGFIGVPELIEQIWAQHPSSTPSRVQTVSSLQTAVSLVAGGAGVALLPESARELVPHQVSFREVDNNIPALQTVLIYRKDRELSPAANRLVDIILELGASAS